MKTSSIKNFPVHTLIALSTTLASIEEQHKEEDYKIDGTRISDRASLSPVSSAVILSISAMAKLPRNFFIRI